MSTKPKGKKIEAVENTIKTRSRSQSQSTSLVVNVGQPGDCSPPKVNNMSDIPEDKVELLLKQMQDLSDSVKTEVSSIREDFASVRSEVSTFRGELASVRNEMLKTNKDMIDTKNTVSDLEKWVEDREHQDRKQEDTFSAISDGMSKMNDEITDLKQQLKQSHTNYDSLKEYTMRVEYQSRRDNIVFHGVPESVRPRNPGDKTAEDCTSIIRDILIELGITDAADIRIVRCHRLGAKNDRNKWPRPIIAKFHWYGDRMTVWGLRSDVRSLRDGTMFITENFPPEIEQRRRQLYPSFKAAKATDSDARLVYDTLTVHGKQYTVDTIDKLPLELQPKYLATPSSNNITAFFTATSPLSNFHLADVVDEDGTRYHSSEQMYQHRKALFHRDNSAASIIMKAKTPYQAYRAGENVKGQHSSEWYTGRELGKEQMVKTCLAKFQQNPSLRQFLLATGNNELVEGNPKDSVWGVKLSYKDTKIFDRSNWKGKNWMGDVLTRVRQDLK